MVEPSQQPEADKNIDQTEIFLDKIRTKVKKSQHFKEYRFKLEGKIENAKSGIDSVCDEIKASMHNEGHPEGFLTSELKDYLSCVESNFAKIYSLLDLDTERWADFSARAENELTKFSSHFEKNEIDEAKLDAI